MARHIAWVIAVSLLVPAAGSAAGLDATCEREQAPKQQVGHPPTAGKPDKDTPGDSQPKKWWIDQKLRTELGITDQQSAAVEQIWAKSAPAILDGRKQLQKLEDALSQMTDVADEAAVKAQIDRVENLRADVSKARTLMIYRMNKVLTPDQRAKVKAMHERRETRRGPSSDK